jgi:uncharacterized membrane protein YtjA (UPF0391 family)
MFTYIIVFFSLDILATAFGFRDLASDFLDMALILFVSSVIFFIWSIFYNIIIGRNENSHI